MTEIYGSGKIYRIPRLCVSPGLVNYITHGDRPDRLIGPADAVERILSHNHLVCRVVTRRSSSVRAVAATMVTLVGLAIFLCGYIYHLDSPTGAPAMQVRIGNGMSARAIGARLESLNLVRSATWFETAARLQGVTAQLEAGNYLLDGRHGTRAILDDLLEAPLELTRVTIPEGLTRMQTAALLAEAGLVDSARFIEVTQHEELLRKIGVAAPNLEGYLFPETYLFPKHSTEEQIARQMVAQFFEIFTDAYFERLGVVGLTLHQAVTLASIVELEAVAAEERPLIAAVFLRRLGFKRRLESCATVEFALGQHKAHLTNEDLKVKSPYNTYRHRGLPPGPIGSAGAASLHATLHPVEDTEYLYFVARGNGRHTFSRTNAEHEVAKRTIRRQARADAARLN